MLQHQTSYHIEYYITSTTHQLVSCLQLPLTPQPFSSIFTMSQISSVWARRTRPTWYAYIPVVQERNKQACETPNSKFEPVRQSCVLR